jgi:large subunit ribosomal protein L29
MELNLFNMRFQASMGKLENTSLLNVTRKDIARAKTILKQKSATGK